MSTMLINEASSYIENGGIAFIDDVAECVVSPEVLLKWMSEGQIPVES
ncbi:MAG: hypothetical protein JXQ26_02680 [Tissierellales bacterium]|nr:hypothetical protein [Tissierellales bacterium]